MKLKNSKMKKILTCLLIGASLTGSVGANAFANSNSNGLQYASKEASEKIIKEIQAAYKSRSSQLKYEHFDYPQCCWIFGLRGKVYLISGFGRSMVGRWQVGNNVYYFDRRTLEAQKGWYNINDSGGYNGRYYFGSNYAALEDGFHNVGHERFCFDGEGRIRKGLMEVDGRTYRGTDKTGAIVTGWWSEGGYRYYFDPNRNGAAHEGWYRDGSAGEMCFDDKGRMLTGLQRFNNNNDVYLFQAHGRGANYYTASGFYTDEKTLKRYYFNPEYGNRALMDSWLETGAAYYKGNGSGRMYFGKDGNMANGVTEIGGEKYLFLQPNNFGKDRLNAYQCEGWYTEPFTGNRYYFNPEKGGSARSISNTPPGAAVKGVQYIDGVRYEFGQDGVLKK